MKPISVCSAARRVRLISLATQTFVKQLALDAYECALDLASSLKAVPSRVIPVATPLTPKLNPTLLHSCPTQPRSPAEGGH